ncbi:Uncharacterized protein APZ42_019464 [Daphnia magna]|uniref:Uncharacterized protein n=1 Tax=Daphnia magna TaxID=35525 RepID=A0A164Y7A5_9CRUS|nr:Uncharacterized protein APZ42_019464 [Daphnia magna]
MAITGFYTLNSHVDPTVFFLFLTHVFDLRKCTRSYWYRIFIFTQKLPLPPS